MNDQWMHTYYLWQNIDWTQIKWKFVYLNSRHNSEAYTIVCKNELQVVAAIYFDVFEVCLRDFTAFQMTKLVGEGISKDHGRQTKD